MNPHAPATATASSLPRLGEYELLAPLGQGGMGTVYKARHVESGAVVALKTLTPYRLPDEKAVKRFRREMEAANRVDHPNVVKAGDSGEAAGRPYLVMELVEGADLGKVLAACRRLPVGDACEVTRQAAEGLTAIDRAGLIHRDLKPSNLMVSRAGRVRVLDMGLAKIVEEGFTITPTDQVMGTFDYMAPEQTVSAKAATIKSDVYSLGCTLYALLTGKPPFAGDDYQGFAAKMRAHQEAVPDPVAERRPDVPDAVGRLVARMLAKWPEDRPTPAEVSAARRPFADGRSLPELAMSASRPAAADPAPASDASRVSVADAVATTVSRREPPRLAPVAKPRVRRKAILAGVIAAGSLLIALAIRSAWASPAVPSPPPTDSGERAAAAREWKVGDRYDLLDRPPVERVWPDGKGGPLNRWEYDAAKRTLYLDCFRQAALELAAVPAGRVVEIEVTFQQPTWAGGIGVFYLYDERPFAGAERPALEYVWVPQTRRAAVAKIERSEVRRAPPAGQTLTVPLRLFAIAHPDGGVHRLRITVGPDGLRAAAWDGLPVGGDFFKHPQPNPGHCPYGNVGIVVDTSSTLVIRATITVIS